MGIQYFISDSWKLGHSVAFTLMQNVNFKTWFYVLYAGKDKVKNIMHILNKAGHELQCLCPTSILVLYICDTSG